MSVRHSEADSSTNAYHDSTHITRFENLFSLYCGELTFLFEPRKCFLSLYAYGERGFTIE